MLNKISFFKAPINKAWLYIAASLVVFALGSNVGHAEKECSEFVLTQTDMNLCEIANTKKSETELKQVYDKLFKKTREENREKLQRAKDAWVNYRTLQCEYNNLGSEGGSIYPSVLTLCYAHFAREYTKILKYQLDCEEGVLGCGGQ